MSVEDNPDWLLDLLKEIQLEQFYVKLRDVLLVTRLLTFAQKLNFKVSLTLFEGIKDVYIFYAVSFSAPKLKIMQKYSFAEGCLTLTM